MLTWFRGSPRAFVVVVIFASLLAACVNTTPQRHLGFEVGMVQAEAFDVACEATTRGALRDGPAFTLAGERHRRFTRGSVCQLRQDAMSADQWWFIQPGFHERYVTLDFRDGRLSRIRVTWRAVYP